MNPSFPLSGYAATATSRMLQLTPKFVSHQSLTPDEIVRRCALRGTPEDWEQFVRCFQHLIAATVSRAARFLAGASVEVVEDLVQETYVRFAANQAQVLRTFVPTHPDAVFGFVKTVALSVATDHARRRGALKRAASRTLSLDALGPDGPGAGQETPVERAILMKEIAERVARFTEGPNAARDRAIFWLHFRDGMTARSIAAIPAIGLKEKGVESVILRIVRHLRESFPEGKPAGTPLSQNEQR